MYLSETDHWKLYVLSFLGAKNHENQIWNIVQAECHKFYNGKIRLHIIISLFFLTCLFQNVWIKHVKKNVQSYFLQYNFISTTQYYIFLNKRIFWSFPEHICYSKISLHTPNVHKQDKPIMLIILPHILGVIHFLLKSFLYVKSFVNS